MTLFPRWLRRSFDAAVAPLVRLVSASGISPNAITSVGTLTVAASGLAFGLGAVRWGALLLLASGLCDVLDGRVARGNGLVTTFGAFYDSTLDRIGELLLYLGIAWYFVSGGVTQGLMPWAMAATFVAAGAGLVVSYARARAEGLGLECKVGLAQRAERIVGLGAPTLIFGAGPEGYLLFGLVSALAVLAVITVIQRILYVHQVTRVAGGEAGRRRGAPALSERSGKGQRGY
jgi:CDP-diacylglycerol--glycerol-3-phosphate 3-phosphatidyltransferase